MVVLGYLIRGPIGGLAWHHLQYVLGLRALGHDVWFFEDSDDFPSCYDPERNVVDEDPRYGLAFADSVFRELQLSERWAYFDAHVGTWRGPAADSALRVSRSADIVLNVSGVNPLRSWHEQVPVRVLVDTDPAFTQARHLTDARSRERAAMHTHFFTFGELFGSSGSSIPDDGFPWMGTRQPIVLSAWRATPGPAAGAFTSVLQWDSYASREYGRRHFGMKSESFESYLDLPRWTAAPLELALGSPAAPREELARHGWMLRDPLEVTKDPWVYQAYLMASKAEFGVAKHGYVVSRSGWFSERSANYLASGRPVVVQETGFSERLPTGDGIVPFSTLDEAIAGIEDVGVRYDVHCHAARGIAEEHFDATRVLTDLIEAASQPVGSRPPSRQSN